jgi:hypothetical protein
MLVSIQSWELGPEGQAELGTPLGGHSVTFWPPLNGFGTGYNLMVTYEIVVFGECAQLTDHHIDVVAHPETTHLRCTYAPDNEKIDVTGLTLWFCPSEVGTEEESWGAIKAMYR